MNQIILIGRLTAVRVSGDLSHPESRYFESGSNVTHFRIAVDRPRPKENQPQTVRASGALAHYFQCEAWGKLGDIIADFTRIGHQVAVSGSFRIMGVEGCDESPLARTKVRKLRA